MSDVLSPIREKFAIVDQRAGRQIQVRADAIHEIATEAEAALIDAEEPIYIRGGLVKPVVDVMPAAHGKSTKVARLREVDTACMLDHMSRSASWTKYNVRKGGFVPTDPPRDVASTILARDGEWRFRRLAGVLTTPTLRPDGTILATAGYDAATQLLLLEPPKLPPIPEKPTKADAEAALAVLGELLAEFPFASDAARAVAFSAIITPVVRGALPVAPLHATTAPVAGSGKSFIIDIASVMSTGERAPVLAAGHKEEETEKRLIAALLAGQPIISIDNVNGDLGGDLLCQMVERPTVSLRALGGSKLTKIESRACTYATGNNIRLLGDMTRRVILCALDPQTERPELRDFKANPLDMLVRNRGRFIAAALTVCRAYAVAGRPGALPRLASFEDWSDVVRSALVWLGCTDPCETMDAARAEDPNTVDLRALLAAWHQATGESWHTTGKIIALSGENTSWGGQTYADLYQALMAVAESRTGAPDARRLGKFLSNNKGRILDGLRFESMQDEHLKQNVWRVKAQEGS